MRGFIIILCCGISFHLFGQETNKTKRGISGNYSEKSEIKVIYQDSLIAQHKERFPAIFIDGKLIEHLGTLNTINPDKIKSFQVEKEPFSQNGKEYYGKINLQTKSNYKPKMVSLKQLRQKYLPKETLPAIFQIDDAIVSQDENNYLVDENYILKIELTKIKNPKLNSEVNFIKLIRKTPENIEKANRVMIRGSEIPNLLPLE